MQITCKWCQENFTFTPPGRGRPHKFCSPECRERYDAIRGALRQRGITVPQYMEMLAEQGNVCAICGLPERITSAQGRGRPQRLAIDHDRETGEIRGLLCMQCNTGIGKFYHDRTRLAAAITYLAR